METSMVRTIDDALIEQVVAHIVEACAPETVIVFGSAARGETRPGSDLDLLVVLDLPEGTTARQMSRKLHALFEGWLLPLDIIVLSNSLRRRKRAEQHLPQLLPDIKAIVDGQSQADPDFRSTRLSSAEAGWRF